MYVDTYSEMTKQADWEGYRPSHPSLPCVSPLIFGTESSFSLVGLVLLRATSSELWFTVISVWQAATDTIIFSLSSLLEDGLHFSDSGQKFLFDQIVNLLSTDPRAA